MQPEKAYLPATAQGIADVIGFEKTMALVRGKRQSKCRSLYVPAPDRMKPSHWLVQTIGEESARDLATEYAGEPLTIPKCSSVTKLERNRQIIQMREQGMTHQDVARAMDMSVSSVKTVYYRWLKAQR
ncbi:helix-turn-helix domain-containing protein [Halodesulfovibrio aestuarii]|uniref:Sigma-70, region 4 n=1 Tax=Halodesulfovibrio aestuarii TaxID=126333 RepID=A0A8G2F8J4_9BACT|nr:helix-turn-helix domain-containing protein [Halodesulfovibrio aestuarii]SHI82476.1 Sigma-70, region 4 [Halodesulfovibrio aestuarii]